MKLYLTTCVGFAYSNLTSTVHACLHIPYHIYHEAIPSTWLPVSCDIIISHVISQSAIILYILTYSHTDWISPQTPPLFEIGCPIQSQKGVESGDEIHKSRTFNSEYSCYLYVSLITIIWGFYLLHLENDWHLNNHLNTSGLEQWVKLIYFFFFLLI